MAKSLPLSLVLDRFIAVPSQGSGPCDDKHVQALRLQPPHSVAVVEAIGAGHVLRSRCVRPPSCLDGTG